MSTIMFVFGVISAAAATAAPAGSSCASRVALCASFVRSPLGPAHNGWCCTAIVSTAGAVGAQRREPVTFADGHARHLKAFGRFAVGLCAIAPIKAVAGWLGVGWDLVKDLFKADLRKRLRRRRLGALRYIAIDEFAVRKGHRYMTVVLDLESGTIVHVQEGKDAAAVVGFLRGLKRRGVTLKAVAIDMSEAYRQAVRSVFGERVEIVHDPYHVVALVNHAIDETRREMMRELADAEREALKGNRFVLLRGFERLNEKGQIRLAELMALNQPLYELYLLKENLRRFWRMPNEAKAKEFLEAWIIVAKATTSTALQTLGGHPGRAPCRSSRLLPSSDHHRAAGGHQQQDQSPQATGLRLPGHGVFQAPAAISERRHLRFSRMPLTRIDPPSLTKADPLTSQGIVFY